MTDTSLIKSHQAAQKRERTVRWAFPVAMVALVGTFIVVTAQRVDNISEDKFTAEVEKRFYDVVPMIQSELGEIATHVQPVFEREFSTQWQNKRKAFETKIIAASEQVQKNSRKNFDQKMAKSTRDMAARQRAVLIKHIPALKGDVEAQDRVLASVRGSIIKWGVRQLNTTLHKHVVALEDIRKTLNKDYTQVAGSSDSGQGSLGIFLELVNEVIGSDDNGQPFAADNGGDAPAKATEAKNTSVSAPSFAHTTTAQ